MALILTRIMGPELAVETCQCLSCIGEFIIMCTTQDSITPAVKIAKPGCDVVSQAISALRAKASHAADDIGILDSAGGIHITNADQYSIAAARSPAQVLQSGQPRGFNVICSALAWPCVLG